MFDYTSIYERPPYLKARRKFHERIDFWFRLGIGTMITSAVICIAGIVATIQTDNTVYMMIGSLLFMTGMTAAHLWIRPKWMAIFERIRNELIPHAAYIGTKKIEQKFRPRVIEGGKQ